MKLDLGLVAVAALGATAHGLIARQQHRDILLERTQRMRFDQRLALLAGTPEMREAASTTLAALPDDRARTTFLMHSNLVATWYVEYETRLMTSLKLRGCLRYLFEEQSGIEYWDLCRDGRHGLDLQRGHRGVRFLEIVDEEHESAFRPVPMRKPAREPSS